MPRLFYKIMESPKVDAETQGLYVVVGFWRNKAWHDAGNPADHINDFRLASITNTVSRVVTRPTDGWMLDTTGTFHDPENLPDPEPRWQRETVLRDIPSYIRTTIRDYVMRWWPDRQNRPVDHRMPSFQEHPSDPRGVKRADVLLMSGESGERDVP
jgi:hypothetical protein